MDVLEIKTLIDAMVASDLAEMEMRRGGWTLRLSRDPAPPAAKTRDVPGGVPVAAPVPPAGPAAPAVLPVAAPLAGVVYLSPIMDADPFAPVGRLVTAGDTVCIIEAMKVFVEVKAGRAGAVKAVLVETGDEVDAGQPLFRIA